MNNRGLLKITKHINFNVETVSSQIVSMEETLHSTDNPPLYFERINLPTKLFQAKFNVRLTIVY